MGKLQAILKMLQGKKTYLGAIALSLLGAVGSLDALLHDGQTVWLSTAQYTAIGVFIGGLTGVAMRIAVGKATSVAELFKNLLIVTQQQVLNEQRHAVDTQSRFDSAGQAKGKA